MPDHFQLSLDTAPYKGTLSLNTGLFINGEFVDGIEGQKVDVTNPTTGKTITSVCAGTSKDVDVAVEVAYKAYKTSWGLKVPGSTRGRILYKLADLVQEHGKEIMALEVLNTGKPWSIARDIDIKNSIDVLRYYAGWADKVHGKTIETTENKLAYTRHEPYGVVGVIVPWNWPLMTLLCKIAPALATGNTVVAKPSEITPLTALKLAGMLSQAGVPPGVVNIVNGYGPTVGEAMSHHPLIRKISFTGSTLVGRRIQEASAKSNLKVVSLELGGKSPNIIFDDANIEQAVKWASMGVFLNKGEACIAGSRIFVQEGIYDAFVKALGNVGRSFDAATGDPFSPGTVHGPQASKVHFERIMGYIEAGKSGGATLICGGERRGNDGYFVKPTVFADCTPDMKIVREEIFGPVASVIKFKTEEEVIEMANDSTYGLACGLFTENSSRAIRVAHALEAGMAFVNSYGNTDISVPFGGSKQSGFGRELGAYALDTFTQVKAVHINIGQKL
ncbi:hypothetical protein D9758_010819 [Tetrapyrgos nigripes]|uniref:Aldehyde dehydrogenase domain-containing protein n=1 Tax=Tetrapyrgos nigripes TaxID=182062 RepID=A0A8H5GI05_9AGAR|nr:hypothetical protein D9758_010819 [Tetrapyrgos nigripes]